jgi:dihydrofolate reductase
MGKLIYALNVSLDGYVETPERGLDWAVADDELHAWFNDRARELDASLYGRRLYELMAPHWGRTDADPSWTGTEREFGEIWRATPRFVFSATLESVRENTRLVRGHDVAVELARIRREYDGDLEIGGATLAASFIRRGLVDEYQLIVHPVVIGGGTPFFPPLATPIRLRQVASHRFASGVVYLGYEPA